MVTPSSDIAIPGKFGSGFWDQLRGRLWRFDAERSMAKFCQLLVFEWQLTNALAIQVTDSDWAMTAPNIIH